MSADTFDASPPTSSALGALVRALRTFTRRAKITPALRERCIGYATEGGCSGAWNIIREADQIAQYIANGDV